METTCSTQKIRIHDGIVGALYLLSAVLAYTVSIQWLYLTGAIAVLQISSYFTGFCPVYYLLNKIMPDSKPNRAETKTAI